jgi:ribose transport system permease protein
MTAMVNRVKRIDFRDYGIVYAFLALFIALSFASNSFLKFQNMSNILDQWSAIGLLACGETICIISGVFDLSVGAIVSVSGVVACKVANSTSPTLGLITGVATGLGLGIVNGIVIDRTRINSFIGTLATSIVYGGLAIIITGGLIQTVLDPSFGRIGQDELLQITYTGWVWIIFALVTGFVLSRTIFGRYVYAVGGNAEAARLSGVRVGVTRGTAFAISGLAAGLAGVLLASRTQSAAANLGSGMELTAISAAVVGGTSILGGEGAIWRAVFGTLLLAIIGNGFNLLNIDTTYQQIVQGGLILLAVAFDQLARRR